MRYRAAGRGVGRGKEARVSRASTVAWMSVVVGLALAQARVAAQPPLPGDMGGGTSGQAQGRPARVRGYLDSAIESYRRGDYEFAATYFHQAQAGQDDLTATERQDLTNWLQLNNTALKARRDGAEQLRQAERALRSGQGQEAQALLKAVTPNQQFLTPEDKRKAHQLAEQVRPSAAAAVKPASSVGSPGTPSLARTKLAQARALLTKGNYEAAEALVAEADKLGATYSATEDTPKRVREDIAKTRAAAQKQPEAKDYLNAARTSLAQGDLDAAEQLAHEAEKVSSTWSLWPLRGDSPSKVLKEVQAERAKQQAARKAPSMPKLAVQTKTPPPVVKTTVNKPEEKLVPDNTDTARQVIKQGRKALESGDLAKAKQLAGQAKSMKPELHWWDDTPEKLLTEIQRVEAARQAKVDAAKPSAVAKQTSLPKQAPKPTAVAKQTSPSKAVPKTMPAVKPLSPAKEAPKPAAVAKQTSPAKEKPAVAADHKANDPRVQLKQARQLLEAGKLDEAEKLAQRARTSTTRWGLFEESPDKLLGEINKVRNKRNQEESVRLLAEGRKLYAQGNYDAAEAKANRAARLHGPYGLLDLGDRPQKLIAEIETARAKSRKQKLPPAPATAVAKKDAEKAGALAKAPATSSPGAQKPAENRSVTQVPPPNLPKAVPLVPKARDNQPVTQVAATKPPAPPVRPSLPPAPRSEASRPPLPKAPSPAPAPLPGPDKTKAQQLLAQARQHQKDGRLAEARLKALEAQKVGATFGPSEDRPELALLDLAALCDKRIDSLKQRAQDYLLTAATDPSRFQKAEANLVQARQLAVAFGFDSMDVDDRMAQLYQRRNQAVAAAPKLDLPVAPPLPAAPKPTPVPATQTATLPPLPAPPAQAPVAQAQHTGVAPVPVQTPAQVGQRKLDQARMELRKGETENARRIAAEVYSGPYGLQADAEKILRSIDAEEFNQRILAANRTFEAGRAALHRREYAQASAIFRSLDVPLLAPEKQAKLKELMQMPELQPRTVAQASGKTASDSGTPGTASVRDLAPAATQPVEESFAKQVQAMQEVKFQKMRDEGLHALTDAGERFRTGETDRALEILQEYLGRLQEAQLEGERVVLLRRPIEARQRQYTTLKQQRDFERLQKDQHETAQQMLSREARAEENKKKQIAQLMKQYQSFFKEGKYTEAEMYAMRAQDLDPDDPIPCAAIYTARIMANQVKYNNVKRDKEVMVVNALDDAEKVGPAVTSDNPLAFDAKIATQNRSRKGTEAMTIGTKGEKEQQIERRLITPLNLNFSNTPLQQVIDDLRDMTGLNIVPDRAALDEHGISLDRPITMKLEGVTLKSALNLILRQVHLTYLVKDEVLQITTEDQAKGKLITKMYAVPDLVLPIQNSVAPNNLMEAIAASKGSTQMNGVQPVLNMNGLGGATPVSATMTTGNPQGAASMSSQNWTKNSPQQTMEDALIKLITSTIKPESWSDMGGPGTIQFFPIGLGLAITQTPDIQEQVAELLAALRRLQEQEVAVEVRFISIAESFFERIGLDFNINVKTDKNTTRYEPQIVTQQFKPFGFINDFNPRYFVTGLTPAGTFTSDLDIPIRAGSFDMAIPPFGAFPNIPGGNGGLELGLAFLSDIQVFLFMEAAQGDQRTNVMQAPKLTLFNGQTSTLIVNDLQFFVTGVTVIQAGGQIVFSPQNTPLPTGGVNLTIQAVISADRRYVRMSLTPSLTNLASAIVPLFPITTFITPVFESGAQGQPVPFTQFIQQPVFNTISVSTTVSVPDGGTVLLGGLKRLSEGRNEFGPPILSKIPYVNRLFKNVGYGREAESLMLMVTPRIIINEEEEARQVPGALPPGGIAP